MLKRLVHLVGEFDLSSRERCLNPDDKPAPTVLVVEDEVLVRMTLAAVLRDEAFNVVEARDADEALVALSAVKIDLLLTDVETGGSIDGLELAAKVRSTRPELKIVIVSGHVVAEVAERVADAFVPKPYLVEKVVSKVRDLLDETD